MLGQCRRRWPILKTALDQCLVWVGLVSCNQFSGYIYAVNLYSIGYCWPTLDRPRHVHFAVGWFFNKICVQKWNISGFRPPLCTYRLNWVRRTSWGWWDDWDDTVLQTQDSKFVPWRSEDEHATSRSRRLPAILTFTRGWGRNFLCFFQTAKTGNRTPNSGVKGSGANHYPRAPAQINTCAARAKNAYQQTRDAHQTLNQSCGPTGCDAGPALTQHRVNASCPLICVTRKEKKVLHAWRHRGQRPTNGSPRSTCSS